MASSAAFATPITLYYRDPSGEPNLKALAANLRTQKETGYLKTDIDVNKDTDLAPIQAAARRISTKV